MIINHQVTKKYEWHRVENNYRLGRCVSVNSFGKPIPRLGFPLFLFVITQIMPVLTRYQR